MSLMTRKRHRISSADVCTEQQGGVRPGAWFADPYETAKERWWDGKKWTDQVRGEAMPLDLAPEPAAPSPTSAGDQPPTEPPLGEPSTLSVEPHVHDSADAASDDQTVTVEHLRGAAGDSIESSSPNMAEESEPREEIGAVRELAPETDAVASIEFPPPAPITATNWAPPGAANIGGVPTRVCPSCAALCHVAGEFCPHCGASFNPVRPRSGVSTRVKVAAWGVIALLVLGGAGVAVAIKLHHDSQVAAQHRRAAAAAAARRAAAQQAAQQAQAARQAEIATRQSLESQLQTDVTNDATQKANSGVLSNGPALSTTCTPISGGSSQDLSQSTGTYSCLAAYQTNSDGTSTGYGYTGTINFDSGMISWQLGNTP
jgi:type II secretory pathway pseudopilin PulG